MTAWPTGEPLPDLARVGAAAGARSPRLRGLRGAAGDRHPARRPPERHHAAVRARARRPPARLARDGPRGDHRAADGRHGRDAARARRRQRRDVLHRDARGPQPRPPPRDPGRLARQPDLPPDRRARARSRPRPRSTLADEQRALLSARPTTPCREPPGRRPTGRPTAASTSPSPPSPARRRSSTRSLACRRPCTTCSLQIPVLRREHQPLRPSARAHPARRPRRAARTGRARPWKNTATTRPRCCAACSAEATRQDAHATQRPLPDPRLAASSGSRTARSTPSSWPSPTCRAGSRASACTPATSSTWSSSTAPRAATTCSRSTST